MVEKRVEKMPERTLCRQGGTKGWFNENGGLRGMGCSRPIKVTIEEIRHTAIELPLHETWAGTSLEEPVYSSLDGNRPVNQAVRSVAIEEEEISRTVEVYPSSTHISDLLR